VTLALTKPVRESRLHDAIATAMSGGPASRPALELREVAIERDGAPILLAEDNPTNQAVALNILRRRGYRVEIATHGREAVDALRRSPYAAVLMDCQMPILDGYAATAEIRQLEGDAGRTPIIAMTAHAMEGDRERCLAAGMDDYLSKPLRTDDLDAVLARWVHAPEPAVMDRSILRSLARDLGDETVVEQICDLFLSESEPAFDAIGKALATGDAEALRNAAHRLRGSAANVGAVAVASAAGELERLAADARLEATSVPLARLADALALTRAALTRR
jgi:CheY-like chemotaxis protein